MKKILLILFFIAFFGFGFYMFFGITKIGYNYVLYSKMSTLKLQTRVVVKNPYTKSLQITTIAGLPGDTVQIKDAELFVNGVRIRFKDEKIKYRIICFSDSCEQKLLSEYPQRGDKYVPVYYLNLSEAEAEKLKNDSCFLVTKDIIPAKFGQQSIFPFSYKFNWNKDNFGPLVIPSANMQIKNTSENKSLYRILLDTYEKREDKEPNYIRFLQNYYFVLNDKRGNINDSRRLGPIPQKMILGKYIASF